MKTQETNFQINSCIWLAVSTLLLACHATRAQTLVSGNISGMWTTNGNPYIAVDNCVVPSDTNLALKPGVIFRIAENLSVTVNGSIQAVGTPTERISIQSVPASQYWSNIVVNYSTSTNRFKYCDFQNGRRALYLRAYAVNDTMYAEVMNCTFSNCPDAGIYAESEGVALGVIGYPTYSPVLSPWIKNCTFADCGDGCRFQILGHGFVTCCPGYLHAGYGSVSARIIANTFSGLSGTALNLTTNSLSANSTADFLNNTVVNCRVGVDSREPWDARIQNCVFSSITNAVMTAGTKSRSVSYNDFYGNATNFTGYPPLYGQCGILQNRNGTPCDILYNICQNPLFIASNDFHLATNSPCIDAGTPDTAFSDCCFPPSLGTQFPDLGAYGGPDACNWLTDVPVPPVTGSMSVSNDFIRLHWGAIPRSEYQVQYLTTLALVGTNRWIDFTDGRVLATEKPTSITVATNASRSKVFFRIQSLGRTPGN